MREQLQMQIVKKKYFKNSEDGSEGEKKLTWSEKEQLRNLHQSDPIAWDFDILAERFQIQPRVNYSIFSFLMLYWFCFTYLTGS